jgi:hypothetical protein
VGTLESRKIDARNSGLGHPVAAMLQQNGSDVYDRNINKEYEEIPSAEARWFPDIAPLVSRRNAGNLLSDL